MFIVFLIDRLLLVLLALVFIFFFSRKKRGMVYCALEGKNGTIIHNCVSKKTRERLDEGINLFTFALLLTFLWVLSWQVLSSSKGKGAMAVRALVAV
jgi:hypothetical protein